MNVDCGLRIPSVLTPLRQMWETITVSDGTTRQLQWTSRVEGDSSITNSTRKIDPTPSFAFHLTRRKWLMFLSFFLQMP